MAEGSLVAISLRIRIGEGRRDERHDLDEHGVDLLGEDPEVLGDRRPARSLGEAEQGMGEGVGVVEDGMGHQLLSVVEVVVDRARRDLRLGGDRTRGCTREPLSLDHPVRRLQDVTPDCFRIAAGRGAHGGGERSRHPDDVRRASRRS
jgi:hypothetical protein